MLPGRRSSGSPPGRGGEVDVIVGTNIDDWRLWLVVSGAIGQITDEILTGPVRALRLSVPGRLRAARGGRARRLPGPVPARPSPGDLLASVQTDWWMRIPAMRLADAHAAHGGAPARTCTSSPGPAPGSVPSTPSRCRSSSTPSDPDAPLFGPLLGTDPPQHLARAMHGAWVAFATTGDPGWPRYDLDRRATMRFDTTSQVVPDPRSWERALWEGIR